MQIITHEPLPRLRWRTWARDVKETAPVRDAEGKLWATWEHVGPPRFYYDVSRRHGKRLVDAGRATRTL